MSVNYSKIRFSEMLLYPLFLVVVLIAINVWGGAIELPILNDNAQRDFNTAIGVSLLSGYFLLTIRFIHKNLAVNLYAILVIRREHSLIQYYQQKISQRFKKHMVWSATIGFIMPINYMIVEGVISRIDEPEVMVVAITAIPFWFLASLFFIEMFSSNKLLQELDNTADIATTAQINLSRKVLNVGLTTATIVLSGSALMPVFWINQPVHLFDLFIVVLMALALVLLLMWPLFKISLKLRTLSHSLIEENDRKIAALIKVSGKNSKGKQIEQLLTEQEQYLHYLTPGHRMKFLLCALPLPSAWLCFVLIESILLG